MPYPPGYGFPLPFGWWPSLIGSSCSRWGIEPSLRSAYRHLYSGPHRGFHVSHEGDAAGVGVFSTPEPLVSTLGLKESPVQLRPTIIVSANVSMTSNNDAYEDSLSFTRPAFAWPDSSVWLGGLLGFFPGSFTPGHY